MSVSPISHLRPAPTDQPTIALLGTGRMGAPIARNLLAAGFPVRVWNRTTARARRLMADGAHVASTPAAAADGADILLTMLADGPATERVVSGRLAALPPLAPEAIWVQMGTIGLEWTERLAAMAHVDGVSFVDAPVSGGDGPAQDGQLTILASGDETLSQRLAPVFDAIGRRTVWVGPAGRGSAMKLTLNAWLAAITETAAETVVLSEALDLDPSLVIDTIADLPLGAPYAVAKAHAMIARRFEPGFALRLARKDVGLALSAADHRTLELPLIELVDAQWTKTILAGHGDEDVASVVTTLRRGD